MTSHPRPGGWERLMRHLLPAGFRASWQDEVIALARAEEAAARRRGRLALLRFRLATVVDLVRAGWQTRSGDWRGGSMWDDLKFAVRRLRHSPGFTLVAVLTLAVAVGANTAILSIADAVLFRPLPYQDPDRLFVIQVIDRETQNQYTRVDLRYLDQIDAHDAGLSPVGIVEGGQIRVVGVEGVENVRTAAVTVDYFAVLGIRAWRGRLLGAADLDVPGQPAVLSYASWQDRFGGAESIVGRTVTVGDQSFSIVGILPREFVFPTTDFIAKPEIVTAMPRPAPGSTFGAFHPIVRLLAGSTREEAQAALFAIGADVNRANPEFEQTVPYLNDARSIMYPVGRTVMRLMLAAAVMVLLLACANLANLLLARGRRLQREAATRLALGASATRVTRPVVLEALLIGAAGGGLAVVVTALGFDALRRLVPPSVYGSTPIGVDARVLIAGMMLGLLASLLFSLAPVVRARRLNVQEALRGRQAVGGRSRGAGSPMVTVQVALAVVLVSGAAIATRALVEVLNTPLGFEPDRLLVVSAPQPDGAEDRVSHYRRAIAAIEGLPGVVSAGGTGTVPLTGGPYSAALHPETAERVAAVVLALPGHLETLGLPLRQGRSLAWSDVDDRSAAVVSVSAARALFGDAPPIGRTFDNGRGLVWRVVGVVDDVRGSLTNEFPPTAYALPPDGLAVSSFVVRTHATSPAIAESIRQALLPFSGGIKPSATWLTDRIGMLPVISHPRFQTVVLTSFGGIALALTALGVFAVVAFVVVSRSREMGIRIAIGARPESLVRLIVRQSLVPVGIGLVLGLGATRLLAGIAEAQLYDVNTNDPATLALAAATVVGAALVAAWIPARRASRVDPLVVLKAE